jgi:arylsulfatase A-like enzyme
VNVLLITTDQQRADSIGAYGNPVCETPSFDALAAAGTRFTAARTQNPLCQPVRASILTGTYPSTHGVTCNGIDLPDAAAADSFASHLAGAGYRTALFGKAHFASVFPLVPTGRLESVEGSASMPDGWTGPYFGFGHVQLVLFGHNMRMAPLQGNWNWCFGPAPMGLHYGRWLFRDGPERGRARLAAMQPEAAGRTWDRTQTWANRIEEHDHPTTWIAERAIEWLRTVDGPFAAWVSFTDPHHPMDAPEPWCSKYAPEDVLEVLPEAHPEEFDTKPPLHRFWTQGNPTGGLFDFANPGGAHYTREELARMTAGYYGMVSQLDHQIGRILAVLDERGLADDTLVVVTTDHGELLGHHQMIFKGPVHYDDLLRVPLIVRGRGFGAGDVRDDPVGSIDLAPTVLAAAGVPIPDTMEGAPLHDTAAREHVITEDDFDIVLRVSLRTLTTRRYKLTRNLDVPESGELYDLHEDPDELVNRFDDAGYADVRKELEEMLVESMNHDGRSLPKVGLVG